MLHPRSPRVIRSASTPSAGGSSSPSSDVPSSPFFERSASISSGEFAFPQSPAQVEDPGTPRLLIRASPDAAAAAEPGRAALDTSEISPLELAADFRDESSIVVRRASGDSAMATTSGSVAMEAPVVPRCATAPLTLRKPAEWAEWHCWRHGRQGSAIPKPSIEEIREALSATHIAESRKSIQQSAADAWKAQEEFKRGVEKAMARHEAAVNFMGGNFLTGSSSMIGRLFEHMKGKNSSKSIKA
ncbi:hypothetical protein CLOM_g3260 [Closterium sp. NIES-68]|nr:hypothetical protein CLOM_g3260 [Closterium sp. NIES-68]GJP76413.1 hypothetical protein CLOP_g6863 [Closterium sp. NIES-67]